MAVTAVFDTGMSQQQYDQVVKALEAAGLGSPDGRIHHVASISKNSVFVVDLWESEEKLGRMCPESCGKRKMA